MLFACPATDDFFRSRIEQLQGIASTLNANLIVGPKAFPGNPYDGHTLNAQLEQASILMQDNHTKPVTAFVDLGYRGVDAQNPDVEIVHRGKAKRIGAQDRKLLKRRQAIEPIIGHLKADHRMDRCHLKGERGDRLHPVLCAAGYNIRWLLRMIVKKGVAFLGSLFCTCLGMRMRKVCVVCSAACWNSIAGWRNRLHQEHRCRSH